MTLEDMLADHGDGASPGGEREGGTLSQDGDRLTVTTGARDAEPDDAEWRALLDEWGYSFDEWVPDVDGKATVKGFESFHKDDETGEAVVTKLRSWTLTLRRRRAGESDPVDVEAMRKQIRARRPRKPRATATDAAFVVALADWQIGKGEGDGTAGTVERIQSAVDEKVRRARASGASTVHLAGLGDLCEGCTGFYPNQLNAIDLDQRGQMQVASSLLLWIVDQFVDFPRVVVSSVASNHGQNRVAKSAPVTDPWRDNLDLQLLDRVGQVLDANPARYGHVEVVAPTDRTPESCTIEHDGAWIVTHHGHFRGPDSKPMAGGSKRLDVALNWWMANSFGGRGGAGADLLLFGHGHHFLVSEKTHRPAIQAPACDPGSESFTADTGLWSPPGVLSFMFGRSVGARVYADLALD